ncbi:MAG: Lrp/AsnC family transcriptional regulator [bacterium]|nr:Lrp/AsnC family transcriptional regulator [bacterium]
MDELQQQVLTVLKDNARLSNKEIASRVNSDESAVSAAIKALEKTGIILGYGAVVNDEVLADHGDSKIRAFVELKIQPVKQTGYDAIAKRIYSYPNVVGHYLLSGNYDFLVIVEAENPKDIAAFVFDKLATIENVTSTNTHFIFKKYKESGRILQEEDGVSRMAVMA